MHIQTRHVFNKAPGRVACCIQAPLVLLVSLFFTVAPMEVQSLTKSHPQVLPSPCTTRTDLEPIPPPLTLIQTPIIMKARILLPRPLQVYV